MHKKILKDATDEQVREFVTDFVTMLKAKDYDTYKLAEDWLYKQVYGCHFTDWLLKCALESMENEDGTKGGHWSVDETSSVASKYGVRLNDDINKYDWNYAMNMVYSDFYGAVPDELSYYVNIAKNFLHDKDAASGKAYRYYISMRE